MELSGTFRLPALGVQRSRPKQSTTPDPAVISPAENSDEDLMSEVQQGNTEALTALFTRYARMVRGVGYHVLHDAAEADDLVQDIFLLIHRKSGLFDPSRGAARGWILAISHRCALARRRHLNSRRFYTQMDISEVEGQLSATTDHQGAIFGDSALLSAFECLSADQRETLRLFFAEGYTLPEIGAKLNQTHGNVKHHYFRGLEKLRKHVLNGKLRGNSAV